MHCPRSVLSRACGTGRDQRLLRKALRVRGQGSEQGSWLPPIPHVPGQVPSLSSRLQFPEERVVAGSLTPGTSWLLAEVPWGPAWGCGFLFFPWILGCTCSPKMCPQVLASAHYQTQEPRVFQESHRVLGTCSREGGDPRDWPCYPCHRHSGSFLGRRGPKLPMTA